jgi:hypothetical protein
MRGRQIGCRGCDWGRHVSRQNGLDVVARRDNGRTPAYIPAGRSLATKTSPDEAERLQVAVKAKKLNKSS